MMLTIMPLGDSITAGYFVGKGGYRDILRRALAAQGVAAQIRINPTTFPLRRDDADGLERVAQHIIRNPLRGTLGATS